MFNMQAIRFCAFDFSIKFSLFKLLCTLVRLYEETSLQLLRLKFFELNFPCIPAQFYFWTTLTISVSHFSRSRQQGGNFRANQNALLPNQLAPETSRLTLHLSLSSCQGKPHAAPWHSASLRAYGGTFPLRLAKYFIHTLTLFLLWYLFGPFCS